MSRQEKVDLSLVVPAYNEQGRLSSTLSELHAFSQRSGLSIEIIVADDGSSDDTASIASSWRTDDADRFRVRCVSIRHRGKGAAVRAGMSVADADVIGYSDADLSAGSDAIDILYQTVVDGADMSMASRGLPESILVKRQPWYREAAGRLYNKFLRVLTGIPFRDTQCGLKVFRRDVAREIFRHQRLDGFAFDAELVVLAMRLGYRVEEIPIRWSHSEGSKMSMLRDSWRMARDLVRIVRRTRRNEVVAPGVPAAHAMKQMTTTEDRHWWHVSKRLLVGEILEQYAPTEACLDVGCGGGAMLAATGRNRINVGVDLSAQALHHAEARGLRRLVMAEGGALPFADNSFGVALALDVVEHHAQPEHLLAEIRRVLRPGGVLVVTVPAYQWMWSYADHVLGHYRRYVKPDLGADLTASGFAIERSTYFHSWLLPVAWTFRRLRALFGREQGADDFALPGPMNRILLGIARLEARVMKRRDLPFGLSIVAVARVEAAVAHAPAETVTAANVAS